jgi:putative heme-binding domain-containing protein
MARFLDVLAARGMTPSSLVKDDPKRLERIIRARRETEGMGAQAADPKLDLELRLASAELLGRMPNRAAEDLATIAALLSPQTAPDLQLAAVRAAVRTGDASVPQLLLKDWPTHSPALRTAVVDALLPREPWALALAESPAARTLDFSRRQRLLNHGSASVKAAAKANLADATVINVDRQKVIDANQPALTLAGDKVHGLALYGEHCATCHRVGSATVGHDLGPNLLTVRDWPKENLLTAILDPDRTVEPRYLAYTATLADGTAFTGLLTAESAASVTIKTLDDADHALPRTSLKSLVSTNHSLMPQGFESAMSPQDLADLIDYIQHP